MSLFVELGSNCAERDTSICLHIAETVTQWVVIHNSRSSHPDLIWPWSLFVWSGLSLSLSEQRIILAPFFLLTAGHLVIIFAIIAQCFPESCLVYLCLRILLPKNSATLHSKSNTMGNSANILTSSEPKVQLVWTPVLCVPSAFLEEHINTPKLKLISSP